MVRVAILSDTHVPSRAGALPAWVRDEVEAAEHVVHAGDFDSRAAYDEIEGLAADLTAVSGNMDPELGLPGVETADLGGVRFVVTHGTGSPRGYRDRVRETVVEHAGDASDRTVVGVSGHTHDPMDEDVDGIRLLNPGSATGAAPATEATMLRVRASGGEVDATLLDGGR